MKPPANAVDLAGRRFGMLTVLRRDGSYEHDGRVFAVWLCRCDCGAEKRAQARQLRCGGTTHCGCSRRKCHVSPIKWTPAQIAEILANWQTRSLEDTGRLYRCSPKAVKELGMRLDFPPRARPPAEPERPLLRGWQPLAPSLDNLPPLPSGWKP